MTSDILIIGGGVIGLAIAVELKLRGANVTVLCRDFQAAATHAAAGMLAPDAEQISDQGLRSLCWRSRSLYPDWTRKLEDLTGLNSGYWACGILAPVYEKNAGNSPSSHARESPAYWLDQATIHQYQPGLGKEVVGGWWYPEDAQVDNRALAHLLWSAAESLGVELKDGITVEAFIQQQGRVIGVQTSAGVVDAGHYVLAAGAWSNELLPLPVQPRKGQMLSVRVPEFLRELPLKRVLFGQDIYIVPRRDRAASPQDMGSMIIGATSEDVGFTPNNTPIGIQTLLQQAIRLYPQLQDYPIQELWWGFRPTTPDELPILGVGISPNYPR